MFIKYNLCFTYHQVSCYTSKTKSQGLIIVLSILCNYSYHCAVCVDSVLSDNVSKHFKIKLCFVLVNIRYIFTGICFVPAFVTAVEV